MAFDVGFESAPPLYHEIYKMISSSPAHSRKDLLTKILLKSNLPNDCLSQIWDLISKNQSDLTSHNVFQALALIGWAQQGLEPSTVLFDDISKGLPLPSLGDLSDIKLKPDPTILGLKYSDLIRIDTIQVDIVPEKKGLFLKHVEYQVISKRFASSVYRRYNDFVALYDLLLSRFPYRLIPKLPPKRVVGNGETHFVEDRRKSLRRWLTLIARHPVLSDDPILLYFLTQQGPDIQYKIREVFRRIPDEFTTSDLAASAKDLVPAESHSEFAAIRDQINVITNGVSKIKQISDLMALRSHSYSDDMSELGVQLDYLFTETNSTPASASNGSVVWPQIRQTLGEITARLPQLSQRARQQAASEEETVCDDLATLLAVLHAHGELCVRVERGVADDHQRALSRMLALKKRQIQGVLRGTADAESVAELEQRMLTQESVIASVELRAAYSLHCVHMETQLVHAHLHTLAEALNSLVTTQITAHSQFADVWKQIHPTVLKCLPDKTPFS
ncbi:hypothetical protein LSTR_LSTR008636 [Laodelphax striatellus]|uniref:PX domain-containing protein n=1 Tax=Laodelphax striatellus TaxID=195883 RepID=A0A482WN59_LAOST|nr:hypothetical protein LSTR_LSTR008636 [Laodelphax striatellus]